MARPLFEQYKDALRRGHLALLGDDLEPAVAAYREAATLVPDRPLPYASMAAVLVRLDRPDEALAAYDQALTLGSDDPSIADARARLIAQRAAAGAPEPDVALATEAPAADGSPAEVDASPPDASAPDAEPGSEHEPLGDDGPAAAAGSMWPAVDLPSPPPPPMSSPPPDPAVLEADAEASLAAGKELEARDLLLTAVAVYRQSGQLDAAIDACLELLAIGPGDPRIHLAIANLQLDRGWDDVATEKIELLLRLTALSGDTQAEADVHLLAAERLRDESPARLDARRRGVAVP